MHEHDAYVTPKNLRPTARLASLVAGKQSIILLARDLRQRCCVCRTCMYNACDGQTTSRSAAICAQNMRALAALPLVSYLVP
jgi:hypothetical protein